MSITAAIEANEHANRELADAVDAHCPVLDLFANPTPIERRLAIAA
jgi:hypothetical protein